MIPIAACQKENEAKLYWNLYRDFPPMQQSRFRVGDKILIIKKKRNFEDVYTPRWPEDVFGVSQIITTKPPKYRLKDFSGEEIQGSL